MKPDPACLLTEVAEILTIHGHLRCVPMIERTPERIRLTLDIPTNVGDTVGVRESFEKLSLFDEMEYLVGISSIRGFATAFGIDSAKLEPLLPKRKPDETD